MSKLQTYQLNSAQFKATHAHVDFQGFPKCRSDRGHSAAEEL